MYKPAYVTLDRSIATGSPSDELGQKLGNVTKNIRRGERGEGRL